MACESLHAGHLDNMLFIETSCTYFMQTILQHWILRLQCPQTVTVVRLPPNPVNRGQDILSSDAIFDFHTDILTIIFLAALQPAMASWQSITVQ